MSVHEPFDEDKDGHDSTGEPVDTGDATGSAGGPAQHGQTDACASAGAKPSAPEEKSVEQPQSRANGIDPFSPTAKNGPPDISQYLDTTVYPALFAKLDVAFPQLKWTKRGDGAWEATCWPDDFPYRVDHPRPDRLMVYPDARHWIKIHGHGGLRFLDLVNGGTKPTGEAFKTAVKKLCDLAGVPCPLEERTSSPEEAEAQRKRDARCAVLTDFNSYCQDVLWTAVGDVARGYLIDDRGLTEAEIRELGLGLYLSVADVREHLVSRGHDHRSLDDAGVLQSRLEGFISIPWLDENGRPLTTYFRWHEKTPSQMQDHPGYAKRRGELLATWKAKNDGTPWVEPTVPKTTTLAGKGTKRSPYCLDRLLRAKHREAIVVEGVFDAAYLQVRGETRAIASVAAQLNGEQVKTLVQCRIERVYICGDPDGGGDRGTLANIVALNKVGIPAYVVPRLPEGMDPDEFVRAHGIDAWRKLVAQSEHHYRYRARIIVEGHRPQGGEWTDASRDAAISASVEYVVKETVAGGADLDTYFVPEACRCLGIEIGILKDKISAAMRGKSSSTGSGVDSGQANCGLITRTLSSVQPTPVRWHVPGYIPEGKLIMFAGDGGHNKSTMTLDISARYTTGRCCLGLAYEPPPPCDVLLISCEDGLADTIVPRLMAAGADLKRVHFVDGVRGPDGKLMPFCLSYYQQLEQALEEHPEIRLIIIDPAGGFIGKVDDHKDSELRTLLGPLADLADRKKVSILLVKHFNKGVSVKAVYRVSGSQGYVNAVRAAFVVAPDDDDPEKKLLLPVKFNLSRMPSGLGAKAEDIDPEEGRRIINAYCATLDEADREALSRQMFRIKWLGQVSAKADDVVAASGRKTRDPNKVELATEWLKKFLAEYAYPQSEIKSAGRAAGFSENDLFKARQKLGKEKIGAKPDGHQGEWWWGPGHPSTWKNRPTPWSAATENKSHNTPISPNSTNSPNSGKGGGGGSGAEEIF
jgi:hypothetical protein